MKGPAEVSGAEKWWDPGARRGLICDQRTKHRLSKTKRDGKKEEKQTALAR